jgi:hypothetical protein
MAAERDQAGSAGSGMSGTGRDAGGLNAGTAGSSSMGDHGLGSAEVHTGLHSGGSDEYSGLQFAGRETASAGGRLRGAAETVRERVAGPARNLGARASEATSGVRDRLGGVRERANTALESRGILDRLRENPLPLIGVAFALGFVLAGSDDADDEDGRPVTRASRARRELRSALMAGVSAGIAQGARGFLNQAGSQGGGFVNGLLENLLGSTGGGGSSEYGSPRSGGTGGSTGGSSYGGSTGGTSRGGSTGGSSTGRSGSYTGGSTGHRPPSHQEY